VGHKHVIIQTNADSKTALSEFEKDMTEGKMWKYDYFRSWTFLPQTTANYPWTSSTATPIDDCLMAEFA
jgi:hypothetical protein